MKKPVLFILSVIICPLIAGLFGFLHNQFTYSVSPEFFTAYLFERFGLVDFSFGTQRLTAGIIGIWSTWWFGLIIGFVFAAVAFNQTDSRKMFQSIYRALLINFCVAITTGLIGLLYGRLGLSGLSKTCCFPLHIEHKERFIAVSEMHNFSYIGGILGIIAGVLFQLKKSNEPNSQSTD